MCVVREWKKKERKNPSKVFNQNLAKQSRGIVRQTRRGNKYYIKQPSAENNALDKTSVHMANAGHR